MFGILCALLFLQCVLGSPIEEGTIEYREWVGVPSRAAYARDFDRWLDFDWVPNWTGYGERVKVPTLKERVLALENRQKALFDLVRCESYGQADCSLFRTEAETIFEAPSKQQQNLTPPTKVVQDVTPPNQVSSTAASSAVPPSEASTVPNSTPVPESTTVVVSTTVQSSSVASSSENAEATTDVNQP